MAVRRLPAIGAILYISEQIGNDKWGMHKKKSYIEQR